MVREQSESFPGKGRLRPQEEELRRLRRELEKAKEDREILKKPWQRMHRSSSSSDPGCPRHHTKHEQYRGGSCYNYEMAESFFAALKKWDVFRESFQAKEEARRKLFERLEIFYN